MTKETEGNDKLSAFEWARQEYAEDPSYWQDRAKTGSGLIQQIAVFVLTQAEAQK